MVSPAGRPEEGMRVRALFVEVDELQNRMILSQRQLLQAELLKTVKVGSVVEVRGGGGCAAMGGRYQRRG
jgi:ribosomal protein S1